MSFIPSSAVEASQVLLNNQATDDATIYIKFDGDDTPVPLTHEDGRPIRLGNLRDISRAFAMWF